MNNQPEIALAITRASALAQLLAVANTPKLKDCRDVFNWQDEEGERYSAELPVTRVYFGGEFCDRLLPDKKAMQAVIDLVTEHQLKLTLVTPLVSDQGLNRLTPLLAMLPDNCEVVVNDWGVLRLLNTQYPQLTPIVGRQLAKMIKDPRLPSAQWAELYPHGVQAKPFHQLLDKFNVNRVEMDVPPFARLQDFQSPQHELSVYLPYGFSVKGRMCKIGSLGLEQSRKFSAGHACNKECLVFTAHISRGCSASKDTSQDLPTFQLGNSQFYRHNSAMSETLADAVEQQLVKRLIFAGDWHEDYRTH